MAISDAISSITTHLTEAYEALEEKKATIPEERNEANLAAAILSIAGGVKLDFAANPDAYAGMIGLTETGEAAAYYFTNPSDVEAICAGGPNFDFSSTGLVPITFEFAPKVSELDITEIGDQFLCIYKTDPSNPWDNTPLGLFSVDGLQYLTQVTSIGDQCLSPSGGNTAFGLYVIGELPPALTSIGDNFLGNSRTFNGDLALPSGLTTIGNYFLSSTYAFNQPLSLPEGVTSIGDGFLNNAYALDSPVTVPASVTHIGYDFMSNLKAFTSSLVVNTQTLPMGAEDVGTNSLATYDQNAPFFTQGFTIEGASAEAWIDAFPNSNDAPYRHIIGGKETLYMTWVDTSGVEHKIISANGVNNALSSSSYYLANAVSIDFDENMSTLSTLTALPANFLQTNKNIQTVTGFENLTTITSIGNNCFRDCIKLNCPIVVPANVTTIGGYFLYSCKVFNSSVVLPEGLQSIGDRFLNGPLAAGIFNQPLTLPSTLKSIGSSFLSWQKKFNQPLALPAGLESIGNSFLSSCSSFNQLLTIPQGMTAIDSQFLYTAESFNKPLVLPDGLTSIGDAFLEQAYAFNQPLTIPASVVTIGQRFLQRADAFNQALTIPATVTSVGDNFMQNASNFVGPLTVHTSSVPSGKGTNGQTYVGALSAGTSISNIYKIGVTMRGTTAAAWMAGLPNSNTSPAYRKLILDASV